MQQPRAARERRSAGSSRSRRESAGAQRGSAGLQAVAPRCRSIAHLPKGAAGTPTAKMAYGVRRCSTSTVPPNPCSTPATEGMTHPSACPSLRHTFGLLVILTAPARPTRQLGYTTALVLEAIFIDSSCCWVVMGPLAAGLNSGTQHRNIYK